MRDEAFEPELRERTDGVTHGEPAADIGLVCLAADGLAAPDQVAARRPGAPPGRTRAATIRLVDLLVVLIIVLVVVVVWRGPKTLPLLGRAFGQGVKEARKEIDDIKGDTAAPGDEGDQIP